MKSHRSSRLTETVGLVILLCCIGLHAHTAPADPAWSRYYSNSTANLVVYQPQVDAWSDLRC